MRKRKERRNLLHETLKEVKTERIKETGIINYYVKQSFKEFFLHVVTLLVVGCGIHWKLDQSVLKDEGHRLLKYFC